MFWHFTLSAADAAFIDPGCGHGPADRLCIAIALCMLPWLGFVPDRVVTAPLVAVARLAERLKVDPAEIGSYGRGQTRTEHLRLVARYLGWRSAVAKGRPMAARALWIRSATPRAARRSNRCGAFRRSTPRAISDADELVGLRRKARRRELGE